MKRWFRLWWPVPAALVVAVILWYVIDGTMLFGILPSYALAGVESEVRGNWGTLGDAFGGLLNPMLTFFTIILLIQTIRISQKTLLQTEAALKVSSDSLDATKTQIELNRQELRDNRQEVARAADAQEEISKTQRIQRQEHSFFEAYRMLSESITQCLYDIDGQGRKVTSPILSAGITLCRLDDPKRIEQAAHHKIDSVACIGALVRLTTVCLRLSAGDRDKDDLIDSLFENKIRCFLVLYISNSTRGEVECLEAAIREKRILREAVLRDAWADNNKLVHKAAEFLGVEYLN